MIGLVERKPWNNLSNFSDSILLKIIVIVIKDKHSVNP